MQYSTRISRAYAKMFIHAKADIEKVSLLARELKAVNDAFESSHEIRHFFINPLTPRSYKQVVLDKMAGAFEMSEYTRTLLKLLVRKDRVPYLPAITYELQCLADTMYCRIRVMLTTAVGIDGNDLNRIEEKLSLFFHSSLEIESHIDPSIIGGFIVQTEDKVIDMSVRGQLQKLLKRF